VCNPAYLHIEYRPVFVSESSPRQKPEIGPGRCEWTDDEISAIRVVLQRLTALRIPNSDDAEDLVQDTLLTMIAKGPGSELEKGPLVWSLGILRKKVGNYYRKAQRYSSLSHQESLTWQWTQQSMLESSPEGRVFHGELEEIIAETLAQLPLSQQQAMELLLAGLDPGEIARQLHPERYQNVINRLHRARKKLAKELARYGYGPGTKTGRGKPRRRRIKSPARR